MLQSSQRLLRGSKGSYLANCSVDRCNTRVSGKFCVTHTLEKQVSTQQINKSNDIIGEVSDN
jgi:hypothetical protein